MDKFDGQKSKGLKSLSWKMKQENQYGHLLVGREISG